MASRPLVGAARFALGVSMRALTISGLALALFIAASRGLYANALVLAALILLIALDLIQSTRSADRMLAQFVDGLNAEGYERPLRQPGLAELTGAVEQALGRVARLRATQQRRIEFLESLQDTVAAMLLVVDSAGHIVHANRAARLRLRGAEGPLRGLEALGPEAALRLAVMRPGAHEILRLADQSAVLAQVAEFRTPGTTPARLISIQSLAGELGAVELKAWQDLVRVLAHEMMNSLTAVCSISGVVAERLRAPVTPEGAAALAQAADTVARRSAGLMGFVERYRQLAEMPAAVKAPVKMREAAEQMGALMAPAFEAAGVAFEAQVHPSDLVIPADAELLEQALLNLLKNAGEAAQDQPSPRVRLTFRREDGVCVIEVEDNGPGLATPDPEAVFVPFFSTKQGGSGIGLTLARQVAVAHGGRLEHAPRAEAGTTFRMVLPLA